MKYTEGKIGRVFILKLDDNDMIPNCIEKFAIDKKIKIGQVILLGGVGSGNLVVGPKNSSEMPPEKMVLPIDGSHEILAIGIIAPDKDGRPILHIHGTLGRSGHSMTGCLREGVNAWLVGEVVICEILGADAKRMLDTSSGFTLLTIDNSPE